MMKSPNYMLPTSCRMVATRMMKKKNSLWLLQEYNISIQFLNQFEKNPHFLFVWRRFAPARCASFTSLWTPKRRRYCALSLYLYCPTWIQTQHLSTVCTVLSYLCLPTQASPPFQLSIRSKILATNFVNRSMILTTIKSTILHCQQVYSSNSRSTFLPLNTRHEGLSCSRRLK